MARITLRSYDVSIIAYWKKPNGYIETQVYKTRSLNLAEEVMQYPH